MLPLLASGAFSNTQIVDWRVDFYDSSMSVPERGIGFRLFSPASTFNTTSMQTTSNPTSYISNNGSPVLTDAATYGLTPLVMEYWGGGAPPGIATAGFTVLHWKGFWTNNVNWILQSGTGGALATTGWLSFSGKGFIRVQRNGSDILNTRLNSLGHIESVLVSPVAGDQFDIFYWQLGEDWGGLVGKFVPQYPGQSSFTKILDSQYREAPVLAASIIPYSTATAFTLPQVVDVVLENQGNFGQTTLKFKVPLTNAVDLTGWRLVSKPRRLQFTDPTTKVVTTLKRSQLIKFYGGFQGEQYPRFTGRIVNFNESGGFITVECQDIAERLFKKNVENYPDFISYETFGYFSGTDLSKPVWSVPAYDNWPLEHALKDLCYRGGIDPRLFYGIQQVNNINGTTTNVTDSDGTYQYLVRAKSLARVLLLLQRNARYGNAGGAFNPHRSPDDQYLYRGNATTSILDWARELADTLGYDFRFDSNGNLVILPRNNPSRFYKFSTGTQSFSPTAILGSYQIGSTETKSVNGARIDLAVGRSPNTGSINYLVSFGGTQLASGTVTTGSVTLPSNGIFFYDNELDVLGNNLCIFTLYEGPWGTYNVKVSGVGGGLFWYDSIITWDRDPNVSLLPPLQTDLLIEDLSTQSNAQDSVNNVVVVGAIKSTVTDTQKTEKQNNPDFEYYVSRAVDPSSIWDPSALNYVGGIVSTLIADKKVSNQDYANWAAETLLVRQRDPGPSVRFRHTILPFLEVRDTINLSDVAFATISKTDDTWIQSITETYEASIAYSDLVLTAYPPILSYEPHQSLPVDVIDSTFFGQPLINFTITYPSIDNGFIVNPGQGWADATTWGNSTRSYLQTYSNDFTSYITDSLGDYLDLSSTNLWPPIPDSIALGLPSGSIPNSAGSTQLAIYKNNPYMKFTHIYDYSKQRIYVPCLAGDGGAAYTKSGTGFKLLTGHISYQAVDKTVLTTIYSGLSPFYDPYVSELPDGQLVSIAFDGLVTGYYRVSIWDARTLSSPILIAWLTEPNATDPDPESHWTYLTAARAITFQWDGVDNIGDWNAQQSGAYAWKARGWFELGQKPAIGAGFYAWNDQTTDTVVISNQLDTSGKLAFLPDHYAQFYVKVECKNDEFSNKAQSSLSTTAIRVTNSNNLQGVAVGQNPKSQVFIYTHLPQPTSINISAVEDWDFAGGGTYDPIVDPYITTSWLASGDYASSIRNDKPVRISYQANPRPGTRFQNNRAYTSFKLHNVIHLNLGVLDSFMMFMGEAWNLKTSIEMKRLVNRRLINDQNTLELVDADWRTGDTLDLPNGKWIFRPQDLTIESNGIRESVRYCDYLQVTDIPGYSQNRTLGQPWSRLIIAYLTYIFYLSTYTQDRSGRMVWAIDPTFIDKSKIVKNTFSTTHPDELEDYSIRTIIARQWVDPNYTTQLATTWQIPQASTPFIQFFHQRLDINDAVATDPLTIDLTGNAVNGFLTTGFTDPYSDFIKNTEVYNRLQPMGAPAQLSTEPYLLNRQLGVWNAGSNTVTNFFGSWTWEGDYTVGAAQQYNNQFDPLWIPDLTRDFHPFFLSPPNPYELSRIPFWTKKTLPQYGEPNIYDNYTRYLYGQGTGDPNRAESDFETWFAVSFPANDTRTFDNNTFLYYNSNEPHRTFLTIGLDVKHFTDFTIADNSNIHNKHAIFNTEFDYSRQQEWRFWENYRGIFTQSSSAGGANTVYVTPSSAYLMNSRRYDLLVRASRGPWQTNNDSISIGGIPGTIDSTLANSLAFIYVAQIRGYTSPQDRSWFTWTFRDKYNWYSPSYFPISGEFKLHPRYLYPKYSVANYGQAFAYDPGAWVGWKDDGDPANQQIYWRDSIQESFSLLNPVNSFQTNPFAGKVNASPNDNIFVTGTPRMPLASGPRLAESTDVMITLSLVNSRRKAPVTGI